MVEQTLRDLGLNPNEVKIYLSLLPLEKSPASTLGYRTKLERTTARYTCRQLVKKGVIAEMRSGNTFYYRAESPDKLLYLLESEKKELQEKEAQTQRIMGMLKGMANPKTVLPKVQFHEGLEGLKHVYEDTLKEGKTIYAFENVEEMAPAAAEFILKNYVPRRTEAEIFAYVITPKNKTNKDFRNEDKKCCRETKFLPSELFPAEIEINIYGAKIAFFSYTEKEMFGVIIESKSISNTLKALFDFCWPLAK